MTLKQEKALYYKNSFLGIVGEDTNRKDSLGNDLHVGDIISFEHSNIKYVKVVSKNEDENKYNVFGFGSSIDFQNTIKIVPYTYLTEELFQILQENYLQQSSFSIKDCEVREMTVGEIEKELRCKIKIIK